MVRNLSRVLAERMRKRNAATLRALEQEMRLEQLQKELLAAHEIQTGMLPSGRSRLPDVPGLDVYARMDVVKSVGGDFYDAFALDERRACIAIGDVSGKGMPAALFMVRALTLLRIELIKSNDPGEAMCRFNRALCETNISHMFVSLVVVWVDTVERTAKYVNAGHLPLLHARGDGPFVALDGSRGLIAGVLSDTVYTVATIELEPGDRLLLYTDGVTETRNAQRQFYNLQGLIDFLQDKRWPGTGDLVEAVFANTREFARSAPRSDDITVVAIELTKPGAAAGAP
jgi:sigma-B regulation protein RsbU (phosphoserine phosphatase)